MVVQRESLIDWNLMWAGQVGGGGKEYDSREDRYMGFRTQLSSIVFVFMFMFILFISA